MTRVGRRAREWLPGPSSARLSIVFPGSLWAETWPVPYPITIEPQSSKQERCYLGMVLLCGYDAGL